MRDEGSPPGGTGDGSRPGFDAHVSPSLERAREIASSELVPLTGRPRGAVVVDAAGRTTEGSSVELPSAPRLGICAEHLALVSAVVEGLEPHILSIWTTEAEPDPLPCGICRQVLAELAPKAVLWIQRGDQPPESMSAGELLPRPFLRSSLPGGTPTERPAVDRRGEP